MSEFKKKSKFYLVHVAIGWISVRFVYVVFLCGYLNLIIMFFFFNGKLRGILRV